MVAEMSARGTPIDSARRIGLMDRLRERAMTVPGVQRWAHAVTIPLSLEWNQYLVVPEIDAASLRDLFYVNPARPGYFETMGTTLIRGREIADADRAGWPAGRRAEPGGRSQVFAVGSPPWKVCEARGRWQVPHRHGHCGRIRVEFDEGPGRRVYWQRPGPGARLAPLPSHARRGGHAGRGRSSRAPGGRAGLRVRERQDARWHRRAEMRSWRLGATMFTIFGALALVVAAVGLYSVVAYDVSQRTRELGVRVALGASAGTVLRLVVAEGVRVVAVGLALGAVAAFALAGKVAPLLYDVSAKDPVTYGSVVGVLLVVAVVASLVPAVRASRADPNVALRAD